MWRDRDRLRVCVCVMPHSSTPTSRWFKERGLLPGLSLNFDQHAMQLRWPVARGIQLTLHKPKVVVALAAQAPMLANAAAARICVDRKKKTYMKAAGFV